MSTRLAVTSGRAGSTAVIALSGEADLTSQAEVQAHVDAAFEAGRSLLVFDLSAVGFVDSSFLHTLMRALRRARLAGGDIAVVCSDPQICRMLEVFGLTTRVGVYETLAEAADTLVAADT